MSEIIHRELLDENGETVGYEYKGRLVRCKDCRYRYTKDCEMAVLDTDAYNDYFVREWTIDEGFCHKGNKSDN